MVDIRELSPGMQLKIVDAFTEHHYDDCWVVHDMERWLGQTVTVSGIDAEEWMDEADYSVFIEEDAGFGPDGQNGFYWHPDCFEYIVESETLPEVNESSISSLFS